MSVLLNAVKDVTNGFSKVPSAYGEFLGHGVSAAPNMIHP